MAGAVAERKSLTGTAGRQGVAAEAYRPDARALALLRGVEAMRADLAESGGTFDLDQVTVLLNGISRQAIDKRVTEGSILAVPGPSNRRRYPVVQFTDDGQVVPGLRAVKAALPGDSRWALLHFLVQPHDDLADRRPIDLMKQGELPMVIEAARRVGHQGS